MVVVHVERDEDIAGKQGRKNRFRPSGVPADFADARAHTLKRLLQQIEYRQVLFAPLSLGDIPATAAALLALGAAMRIFPAFRQDC